MGTRGKARLWQVALTFACLGAYAGAALWTQLRVNPAFPSDLGIYLQAVVKALRGADPYQPFQIGASYIYPPAALLIFWPLAQIGLPAARAVWAAASALMVAGAAWALWDSARPRLGLPKALAVVILLGLFAPLLETLTVGQVNAFVVLGIALFIRGYARPKGAWLGDLALAAVILTKMSPALLLAYPLLQGDWRRLGRVAGGAAAIGVVSLLAFGSQVWLDFLAILPRLSTGHRGTINETLMPTLHYYLKGTPADVLSTWAGMAFSALALAAWLVICLRQRRSRDHASLTLLLGVCSMTLASNLIWYHHLLFLALPLVWGLCAPGLPRWLRASCAGAMVLMQANRPVERLLHLPPLAAITGYLLLFVALLAMVWQQARPSPAPARSTMPSPER